MGFWDAEHLCTMYFCFTLDLIEGGMELLEPLISWVTMDSRGIPSGSLALNCPTAHGLDPLPDQVEAGNGPVQYYPGETPAIRRAATREGKQMGLYDAQISAGSLMIPESRRIARLLLSSPTPEQWNCAIEVENLLQKTPATARRQARLIRNRLDTLNEEGLRLVIGAEGELCSQILLAAAVRHSRLLGDFLRDVYIQSLRRLEKRLSRRQWDVFLAECEHRDEAVAIWFESTRRKLFQVIVRILAEAKYIDSTRRMGITPPLLHPQLYSYLKRLGDTETIARMEATL
jgi:hypothetical protein